jgi:hypothetical protein
MTTGQVMSGNETGVYPVVNDDDDDNSDEVECNTAGNKQTISFCT